MEIVLGSQHRSSRFDVRQARPFTEGIMRLFNVKQKSVSQPLPLQFGQNHGKPEMNIHVAERDPPPANIRTLNTKTT